METIRSTDVGARASSPFTLAAGDARSIAAWLVLSIGVWMALAAGPALAETPQLPDGRGYELVSPVFNADGDVYEPTLPGYNANAGKGYNTERPFQASASGEAVAYVGDPPAEGGTSSEGNGAGNEYLATRSTAGWAAANIEPPAIGSSEESEYLAFSNDLSVGVLRWNDVLYARTVDRPLAPLFDASAEHRAPGELRLQFAGGSAGFTHLFFAANDALTPEAVDGGPTQDNLYEWDSGALRSVNVLPDGKADPNAAFPAPSPGSPGGGYAISADGSHVFWSDLNTGDLYLRLNGETTVQVDATVGGGATFQAASADGSLAFFTKGANLYRYDHATGETSELVSSGDVESVLGAGEAGSYLYYVAKGELYLLQEGQAPHLITTVSEPRPAAEVTPDGRHLLIAQDGDLELFDAQSQTLSCVSCQHAAILQPSNRDVYQPRWMSTDARHVFFDSLQPLVPEATNGRLDVYEWESDRTGGCAQKGGCIELLSSPASTDNSFFLDASSSGSDVFIVTRAQLVPEDENEELDVYDVRMRASAPAPATPSCSGSGCQGAPSPPLSLVPPSSMSFHGPGNVEASETASPRTAASVKPVHKRVHHKRRRRKRAHHGGKREHHAPSRRTKRPRRG